MWLHDLAERAGHPAGAHHFALWSLGRRARNISGTQMPHCRQGFGAACKKQYKKPWKVMESHGASHALAICRWTFSASVQREGNFTWQLCSWRSWARWKRWRFQYNICQSCHVDRMPTDVVCSRVWCQDFSNLFVDWHSALCGVFECICNYTYAKLRVATGAPRRMAQWYFLRPCTLVCKWRKQRPPCKKGWNPDGTDLTFWHASGC